MRSIVLASSSPRRKELLHQIGLEFICHPASGEECPVSEKPSDIVQELARQKAFEVAGDYTDAIIIGADTVVSHNGKVLGKPENREHARRMIMSLQGQTHRVYTGVCLLLVQQKSIVQEIVFADETKVEMYEMSPGEIERYTASGEGDDKAGAYGIQGACAAFIKGIQGDYYNVVGLPVARVYQNIKDWL